MSSEVRYKKKDITNLIESGNERELCFLMLYQVYEEGAFSNLVIKKADKIAATMGKNLSFVRAMLYGTLTYSFAIDFLVRHITKEAPEDMDPVSRTIIRMSVWQLQFGNDIPDYAVLLFRSESTSRRLYPHCFLQLIPDSRCRYIRSDRCFQ